LKEIFVKEFPGRTLINNLPLLFFIEIFLTNVNKKVMSTTSVKIC